MLTPEQKRTAAQHLSYLKEVWGEPDADAVVSRALAEAYGRAPSRAQLDLKQANLVRFQVVIQRHTYGLLNEIKIDQRHSSNLETVLYLMELAENDFGTSCRTCVHRLMMRRGQRVKSVMGFMDRSQHERWDVLRDRLAPTNTHGRSKAETLERLIAEAWVRAYKPPHPRDPKGSQHVELPRGN